MIKASSIYYVILLSVLIASVLGSMVLLSAMNQRLELQFSIPQRLIANAESGIAYAEVFHRELANGKPVDISLFGDDLDSVELTKTNWGAFTILLSRAHHKHHVFTKVALSGHVRTTSTPNLFMIDNGRTLSVCGDTRLEGDCYVPSGGLKRAYIAGKNYSGKEMVYGTTHRSSRSLPAINEDVFAKWIAPPGVRKFWEEIKDSAVNSFSERPWIYTEDHSFSTAGKVIKGAVWLESNDSIFIAADSEIDGAVIKARTVHVGTGFTGTLQIFATEKIVLEDKVRLKYPSILGVIEDNQQPGKAASILIGVQSQVLGTVFLPDFRKLPELTIDTEAEVDGLVYCQGKTQLKGTVNGSLITQKFFLKTLASSYENHILDGKVLDQLPEDFVWVDLLKDEENEMPLRRIDWVE